MDEIMLTTLLYIFLFAGLIVGFCEGQQKLESSTKIYPNQSLFKYFMNL